MLAPFPQSSPHEKKVNQEEETTESDKTPRDGSPNIVSIAPGSSIAPGTAISFLRSTLEQATHDGADNYRQNSVGRQPEVPSDEAA